jgi:hypothetical protein
MALNTNIGFSININGIQTIAELNEEINNTSKSLSKLTVGTDEYVETSKKLAKLKAEQKGLAKQQDDLNKSFLEQSQALGSYDKLSAKLNRLRKEYKNLAIDGKGSAKGTQELLKEIQALDKQLKDTDANVGQFQRGVGRYTDSIEEAAGNLGSFGGFAGKAVGGVRALGMAFKAALGPIGLIIAAIGLVVAAIRAFFNSSEEGQNKFRRLQAIAKVVFDNLVDILEYAGEILVGIFEKPVESIKALGNFIVQNITNRFVGLLELLPALGTAIGQVFRGEFQAAGRTAVDALAKVSLGVTDFTKKATDGFLQVNKAFNEFVVNTQKEIEIQQKLQDIKDNLDKRERQILVENARLQQQVAEARFKAAQTDKFSSEERLKFLDDAIEAELKTLKNSEELAATKLMIAKQEAQQNQNTKDDYKEIAELEADLINLKTQNFEETKRIAGQRAALIKELEAEAEKTKTFTEETAKFTETIIEKTNKVITDLIQNEFEKRRKASNENYSKDLAEIDATLEAQKKANIKNLKELEDKYGNQSQQFKDFQQTILDSEKLATEEAAKFKEQRELQLQKEIVKIAEDEVKFKDNIQKKAFAANMKREQDTANMLIQQKQIQFNLETALLDKNKEEDAKKILKLEQQLNQDIYYITANRLKDEQELIENELKNNANLTIEEQTDLNNRLVALKAEEVKQFADAEQKKRDEVKKTTDEQQESQKKAIENALSYAQEAVSIISGFIEAADNQRLERLEKDAEANSKIQEDLNERLQNATGLERRYLEQQLENNVKTAERIEKEKEKIEREAAKKRKATAIIESIINTALAITKALPDPITATIAGVLGALQTAVIAAQPLAKGGVVGKGDEIVQFASGGRVTSKGNIKPLSNGDNVLATLKTGEIVLNESQQRRIGYSTLKKAQIPNFANGGLVGAPSTLITNANNSIANEQMRVNLMDEMISATNNRIDRLSVVYTATTDFEVEKGRNDKKTIKANSTF